jgi:hypothetical protein
MMISELSYLHLQQAEESRFTQELERRRVQLERQAEGADAAASSPAARHGHASGGGSWWAGVLHPRHGAQDAHGPHGARAA